MVPIPKSFDTTHTAPRARIIDTCESSYRSTRTFRRRVRYSLPERIDFVRPALEWTNVTFHDIGTLALFSVAVHHSTRKSGPVQLITFESYENMKKLMPKSFLDLCELGTRNITSIEKLIEHIDYNYQYFEDFRWPKESYPGEKSPDSGLVDSDPDRPASSNEVVSSKDSSECGCDEQKTDSGFSPISNEATGWKEASGLTSDEEGHEPDRAPPSNEAVGLKECNDPVSENTTCEGNDVTQNGDGSNVESSIDAVQPAAEIEKQGARADVEPACKPDERFRPYYNAPAFMNMSCVRVGVTLPGCLYQGNPVSTRFDVDQQFDSLEGGYPALPDSPITLSDPDDSRSETTSITPEDDGNSEDNLQYEIESSGYPAAESEWAEESCSETSEDDDDDEIHSSCWCSSAESESGEKYSQTESSSESTDDDEDEENDDRAKSLSDSDETAGSSDLLQAGYESDGESSSATEESNMGDFYIDSCPETSATTPSLEAEVSFLEDSDSDDFIVEGWPSEADERSWAEEIDGSDVDVQVLEDPPLNRETAPASPSESAERLWAEGIDDSDVGVQVLEEPPLNRGTTPAVEAVEYRLFENDCLRRNRPSTSLREPMAEGVAQEFARAVQRPPPPNRGEGAVQEFARAVQRPPPPNRGEGAVQEFERAIQRPPVLQELPSAPGHQQSNERVVSRLQFNNAYSLFGERRQERPPHPEDQTDMLPSAPGHQQSNERVVSRLQFNNAYSLFGERRQERPPHPEDQTVMLPSAPGHQQSNERMVSRLQFNNAYSFFGERRQERPPHPEHQRDPTLDFGQYRLWSPSPTGDQRGDPAQPFRLHDPEETDPTPHPSEHLTPSSVSPHTQPPPATGDERVEPSEPHRSAFRDYVPEEHTAIVEKIAREKGEKKAAAKGQDDSAGEPTSFNPISPVNTVPVDRPPSLTRSASGAFYDPHGTKYLEYVPEDGAGSESIQPKIAVRGTDVACQTDDSWNDGDLAAGGSVDAGQWNMERPRYRVPAAHDKQSEEERILEISLAIIRVQLAVEQLTSHYDEDDDSNVDVNASAPAAAAAATYDEPAVMNLDVSESVAAVAAINYDGPALSNLNESAPAAAATNHGPNRRSTRETPRGRLWRTRF